MALGLHSAVAGFSSKTGAVEQALARALVHSRRAPMPLALDTAVASLWL